MFLSAKGANKNLQKNEKQAFCSCLKAAAAGPVQLERWVMPASLCFFPSWPEASSWEWPCGSGMTRRRRISSTCSWGTSRPPTPSMSVSRSGDAGVAARAACPGVGCSVPKSRAEGSGEQQVGLKIPHAPPVFPQKYPLPCQSKHLLNVGCGPSADSEVMAAKSAKRRVAASRVFPGAVLRCRLPWSTFGKRGDFLEVCLISYPKRCKSSRRSGWQWKVELGELMTHVLQEGQVEPLCVMVKLSVIFINLTACWLAGR